MINIAKKIGCNSFSNSMGKKIFNSCPIDFKNTNIEGLEQINYTSYKVKSSNSIVELLGKLQNSNPRLKFANSTIIGDKFYDNEESELIKKPDQDIWKLNDLGDGIYSISLS